MLKPDHWGIYSFAPRNQSSHHGIVYSRIGGYCPTLTSTAAADVRAAAIAHGRAIKRDNALTAIVCGTGPAILLYILFPSGLPKLLIAFAAGFLWANFFEYAYHRYLLHLPGTSLARRHLEHHMTVGAPNEAENANLGSAPRWIALLFVLNGVPIVVADLLLGVHFAPGVLVAFTVYFIITEELHWRIHLGAPLPRGLQKTRGYHLAHHARPNGRFNIFLPLWDLLLGTASTR